MNNTIIEAFSGIEDPRRDHGKLYSLTEIIFLTIVSVVCGADCFTQIEQFGIANLDWLRKYLAFENGIPSHDTLGYFYASINPKQFKECFIEWVKTIARLTEGEIVAIDGKTLRRSYDEANNKKAIHMVSAWANNTNLVLGQIKVDEKSNEITAIPQLLNVLELKGCIVTIDAMGTQKSIAKEIIDAGADYVLALKGNQGTLLEDVKTFFFDAHTNGFGNIHCTMWEEVDNDHGRVTTRQYWLADDIHWLENRALWKKISAVGMVRSTVRVRDQVTVEDRYYITSLQGTCETFGKAVRNHWGVENKLHWCLDIAFREDESRIRKADAPDNFAVIRHICLNLLKQEKTLKAGLKGKRLQAGWNPVYREKVIFGK